MSEYQDFNPPHVYAAITEVTGRLSKTGISKTRRNQQQGYQFRGIDDVYNALSSELAEAKLCIIPRVSNRVVTERETMKGGTLFYVVVDVDFDIVSAVDGSRHTAHVLGEAMDSADKATNKAMSAAYKYMAMQVFCIPTEGDNDADAHTPEAIKPKVDPRPDLSDVDPAEVERYVSRAADIHAADLTPQGIEEAVYSLHRELAPHHALYIAVGDALAAQGLFTKAAWKGAVTAHQKRLREAA